MCIHGDIQMYIGMQYTHILIHTYTHIQQPELSTFD